MRFTPLDHPDPVTACLLRYALLHTLPDGRVARWLLGEMPSVESPGRFTEAGDDIPGQWTIFNSPIVSLSPATIQHAVASRKSRVDAEFMGMLLHLATTGRAIRKAQQLSRNLTRGSTYVTTEHGYPETVHTTLWLPASPTIGYLARNWRGPATLLEMEAVKGLDCLEHMHWDRWVGNEQVPTALYQVMVRMMALAPVLWRELGDEPSAWSLALELMASPDISMGDALSAAVATSEATGSTASLAVSSSWRLAPLVSLIYEGGPLVGLHDPKSLRLRPKRNPAR